MKYHQRVVLLILCCMIFYFPVFAEEKKDPASAPKTFGVREPSKWDNIFSIGISADIGGTLSLADFGYGGDYDDSAIGIAVDFEYLRALPGNFKLGVGLSVFAQASQASPYYNANSVGFAPYATFEFWFKIRDQFSNIDEIPEGFGFTEFFKDHVNVYYQPYRPVRSYMYLKLLAGYALPSMSFDEMTYDPQDLHTKGGFYWGAGIGLMQTDGILKGLFVQILYKQYSGSVNGVFDSGFRDEKFTMRSVSYEIGYRF